MQTSPMQPSHDEIQREVENLRDIKRRSTLQGGPGALILDPDLPTPGAQAAAAQQGYWTPSTSDDSSSDSHSHEDSPGPDSASASDDPFHLFWVPANMHPEIDPAQFRAFLKEHARAPGEVGLARSESLGNAALGRKKSMLSRQYRPTENDGVEDERVMPLRRNRSSLYATAGPQLTIKDLEKLDELAEEASQSRDPSKLRSVLRRSLSMNMAPSAVDNLDHAMPDPGEDADAPIIVPRPGQILRRAARTKIRKAGQTGEGAHRFNATRRGAGSQRDTPPPVPDPRSSSDLSTSDHGDAELPRPLRLLSKDSLDEAPRLVRPESYSAESFIFDAYAREESNEDEIKILSPPSMFQSLPRRSLSPPPPQVSMGEPEPVPPVPSVQPAAALPPLEHPLPQRASSLVTPAPGESPSRSPSPVTAVQPDLVSSHTRPEPRPIQTPTSLSSTPPVPQGPELRREKEKDKDKKGLFKWGASEKKGKKEKEQREKEKEASFFGSLFGSKKKQEESTAPTGLAHGQSGREAAVALLGASKSSRGYVPPTSPQPPGVNNYSRYPIHVERAIYRLSHIKLANPRRALYEQVLISNLMFWYLGVINKTQQTQQQQQQQAVTQRQEQAPPVTGGVSVPSTDQEEEGEHTATEKDRETQSLLAAPQAQAQGQAPQPQQQQQQNRRGSLTKAAPSSAAARRAEQPVRGPQYDMQHRAMEQEYGAAFSGGGGARQPPAGAGYAAGPVAMQMSMSMSVTGPGVKQAFPSSSSPSDGGGPAQQDHPPTPRSVSPSRRSRSPPPPLPQQTSPSSRSSPSPLAPHSLRTSPPPIRYVPPQPQQPPPLPAPGLAGNPQQELVASSTRPPARSMSATVAPPVPAHALGGVRAQGRKTLSAHAVLPPGARRPRTADGALARPPGAVQGGEEEDVPLAVWQQQARRR